METEGQSRQRVGGGRSFWLLCVVVFCVVARDLGTYVGVEFFVRESKRFYLFMKRMPKFWQQFASSRMSTFLSS
jgi:hypothetical protein